MANKRVAEKNFIVFPKSTYTNELNELVWRAPINTPNS